MGCRELGCDDGKCVKWLRIVVVGLKMLNLHYQSVNFKQKITYVSFSQVQLPSYYVTKTLLLSLAFN
jgi:hypothetical protein